jgi:phytoene/squalene synthetase
MELYNATSYEMSQLLTNRYSTSFSMSSRLFSPTIRPHIYAVYGMVRLADEIVDTYRGDDMLQRLDDFETEVLRACQAGYSVNPVVHAFALTARQYAIDQELIAPFFSSMRVDVRRSAYDQAGYEAYIYGSAEVIGLMCLKVFCEGDAAVYDSLQEGARALGAAYQKVNFLRDIAADYTELDRLYFPGTVRYETFNEADKQAIIADIDADFAKASEAIVRLPETARNAVGLSRKYYGALLDKIKATPAAHLKTQRVRVPNLQKFVLLLPYWVRMVASR